MSTGEQWLDVNKPNTKQRRAAAFKELHRLRAAIRPGRYAIEAEGGPTKFYRVEKPTFGKRSGYTLLTVQVGKDMLPVKGIEPQIQALRELARNPRDAMMRYGRLTGRCGRCNRQLTNAVSQGLGLGMECARTYPRTK
jgi:hypothetical protein